MTEEEHYPEIAAKIKHLSQKTRMLVDYMASYDINEQGYEGLEKLLGLRDELQIECDDIQNELEVEDFLLHGSRMNDIEK